MVGNPIVVKMIESTIDKTIGDIKDNPKKGGKNLVDLANRFASTRVQKDLVKTLHTMLTRPNSPYLDTLATLVNTINPHRIKTFIINITYNSWSYGGRKIKQYKKAYNYNIPWALIFDFSNQTDTRLSNNKVIEIIEEGKKVGIYTYLFFIDNIDGFSNILKQNPDCAFILYLPPDILIDQNIGPLLLYYNIFFSILYKPGINTKAYRAATKLLYDHHCLFGSHSYYGHDNAKHILSNEWINEIMASESPFGFLIESQDCSQENTALIQAYVEQSKTNPKYPAFLIDLYEDISKVNKQLYEKACVFKIMANGDISCDQIPTPGGFNINTMVLLKILEKII